ncbi:MAG: hypothetical protein LBV74_13055 [Tannerella sp.]|jgi:hypothetical protein|nr:hypothetical protein [Tannerella sp.]
MKVQLVIADNKPIGYNLVPENPDEQNTLKVIQSLHFLADDRAKRISYDGISTGNQGKPDCMYFMQHKYAALPPESDIKQLILKMSGKYVAQKKQIEANGKTFQKS